MTYLIVGNKEENIQSILKFLLEKLWIRDINENPIFDNHNPDIHILDGKEINSIGIEDVKNLQKEMMYSPFKEKTQIAYILEANKLNIQAQNSLLKNLEETKNDTAYILVTNNENTLLPTVLSRCLKLFTDTNVIRDKQEIYPDILNLDITEAFSKIEKISKRKEDTEAFLNSLERYFQDNLEKNLIEKNGIIGFEKSINAIELAQKRVKANGNRRLILENLLLHLVK
jgi:DNA polymerase III gamma/tau subunit